MSRAPETEYPYEDEYSYPPGPNEGPGLSTGELVDLGVRMHVSVLRSKTPGTTRVYAAPLSDAAWARILGAPKASRWSK